MAGFNGSGTFDLRYDWTDDAANSIAITASRFDETYADFKTGLELCVLRDGQNSPSAALPMGGYNHSGVGNASARDEYLSAAQFQDAGPIYLAVAGTDTYTATASPAITAYATGQRFLCKFTNANTGAATININSVGAKSITKDGATALASGDIAAGGLYLIAYDGTQFQLLGKFSTVNTASTTVAGISELATDTEAKAVTSTSLVVTPGNLAAVFAEPPAIGSTTPAAGTFSSVSLADGQLSRPKLIDYSETVNAIGSIGGGTQDIDLELGNVVTGTVDTSTTTFTFSNPPASGSFGGFTFFITNGGSQTVNWPASVVWAGGTAPTLTTSGVDILTFVTLDAGTTYYGAVGGLAFS